ncbi:ABC transporter ATP-binding protein, partial [Blautia pseudococcoides]|nr:ABC transporter ATP-binding protein [Blautia pseudococcoides]
MEAAIKIEGLVKSYEKFSLDHITMEVPKGSIVGLVGANGAGKTTLIKCILGIVKKDSGEIYVDGEKLEDKDHNWKNQVGMVLAESNFHETMNALQIGRIMENIFGQWDAGLYEKYLEEFKLEPKKLIKDYSRGMKMKLQIAVALSHKAKILIFDEATSGLDPLVRDDLLDILLEYIQDEEHTVLLSSHIISDLEKVSDYIAFIQNGKLLFVENKDDILYRYGVGKCSKEDYSTLDKEGIMRLRRGALGYEFLIRDRQEFMRSY